MGDQVEALGFVSHGDYTPILQDSIYHKISTGKPIAAIPLTPDEVLRGTNDCELIQVTGTLLDRAVNGTEKYLVLQQDGFIYHAYLSQGENPNAFAHLENGSRISVTGVCRIDPGEWLAGEDWRARSFRDATPVHRGCAGAQFTFVVDLAPSVGDRRRCQRRRFGRGRLGVWCCDGRWLSGHCNWKRKTKNENAPKGKT